MITFSKAQQQVLDFPWELYQYLLEYRQANPERRTAVGQKKSFFQQENKFTVRVEDVPCLRTQVKLNNGGDICTIESDDGETVELNEVDFPFVQQFIQSIDGQLSIDEIACICQQQRVSTLRLAQRLVGRVIIFPQSVQALEQRISGVEICRIPLSPYQIDRNYWQNMADVRELIEQGLFDASNHQEDFQRFLKALHITASMGQQLDCFYIPQRRIEEDHMMPGAYLPYAPVVERIGENDLFLTVASYFFNDNMRLEQGAPLIDDNNIHWGTLATYLKDGQKVDYFRSPRPLIDAHFDSLRLDILRALEKGDSADGDIGRFARVAWAAADFHQKFVRLHPFGCINQSLAMNIVNYMLKTQLNLVLPHLNLDFCALEFSQHDYRQYFCNILNVFGVKPDSSDAYKKTQDKALQTQRAFHGLQSVQGLSAAVAELKGRPDVARLLGLVA